MTATIIKTKLRYLWVRKIMFFFCNLCYAQLFYVSLYVLIKYTFYE
ncbi:hypothetical protein HMPREF0973_00526 [Prevotella veroralis F0319]|uniref:Uncharacterized protein n=1 Tax=Prevotella veroralis F0319 TaxID=649761 RepID=C9MLQ1_9BACT|nr:hypothetical protein HMPREF0973_00526 [Prevotella veroralis F0319]